MECEFVNIDTVWRKPASQKGFSSWDNYHNVVDNEDEFNFWRINDMAATFQNNEFTANQVGQKGSAIYSREISFLYL